DSKYIFGSQRAVSSLFSMKCYNSNSLTRCFEVDASTKCSDSYFCHNCEGLSEAMFCFNAKAKRHAIGNAELPREKYAKVKNAVVEQIASELERKHELKWDIFNVGCANTRGRINKRV
ncbi:MAG: hypothetical protein ABIH99_02985, partial [Candidatus Micrarchaeota archaeon]